TPNLLAGKVVLITGAGQGNGRAIARGLAWAGATVIATDMNAPSAAETASLITTEGGRAHSYGLDVTNADQCQTVANEVEATVGAGEAGALSGAHSDEARRQAGGTGGRRPVPGLGHVHVRDRRHGPGRWRLSRHLAKKSPPPVSAVASRAARGTHPQAIPSCI